MQIPVKPEPVVVYGQISAVELVEGEYGEQVEVRLDPIPAEEFQRRWWFKPSSRASSKWMKFVTSFNKARGEDIENAEELVGQFVKIEEIEKSGNIRGEDRTWTEPVVTKVYPNEIELLKDVGEEEKDHPPFENSITDPAAIELLKQLYKQQGEETFMKTVEAMGYDPQEALKVVSNGE